MKEKVNRKKLLDDNLPDDYIGRDAFVQQVINTIEIAAKDRYWCFAINGEWGSGKSFVVDMIKAQLDKKDQYLVVKYDAWKNDFYDEPLVAILYNVIDKIENKRIDKEILLGFKMGLKLVLSLLSGNIIVDKIENKINKIKKTIKSSKTQANNIKLTENIQSYYDALETLKGIFKKITDKYKIVVLVDEIDRCEPEYSLSVLNRLHNLFNVPNIITIVSVNEKMLNDVIDNKYGKTDKYLEKFFDLTFDLPIKGRKSIKSKYAEMFLLKFLPEEKLLETTLFYQIIDCFIDSNPRKVERFFNKLGFVCKKYDDINQTYDLICITAYLL
ncbi:MAG: DUF2791 family P-loop domain-containing protein, partial [Clostridia bacterium]|nr:DUF2791 family P-loop domain-containing protein [Clostridia bacterium]